MLGALLPSKSEDPRITNRGTFSEAHGSRDVASCSQPGGEEMREKTDPKTHSLTLPFSR